MCFVFFFKSFKYEQTENGWEKQMQSNPLLSSPDVSRWCVLFQSRDEPKANFLMSELQSVGRGMSFRLGNAEQRRIPDARGGVGMAFVQAITQAVEETKPQIVVCLIPNQQKDIYDAIKRKCCTDFGVPSQVVTSRIINPDNWKTKSVITKIAIQMSCKLGGVAWAVEIPVRHVMFIGMDTFKDMSSSSRGDGRRSVSAFVASMDGTQDLANKLSCTRYFSKTHIQPIGQEFACLKNLMKGSWLLLLFFSLSFNFTQNIN